MCSTFKVLFYLKKNAPKKNGSVPVMCRITIDGTIAQFSCKCDIFLRTEKQSCHNTVWIYMMLLRRMITIAQNHGWIVRDPFVDYSISAESTDRDYLKGNSPHVPIIL